MTRTTFAADLMAAGDVEEATRRAEQAHVDSLVLLMTATVNLCVEAGEGPDDFNIELFYEQLGAWMDRLNSAGMFQSTVMVLLEHLRLLCHGRLQFRHQDGRENYSMPYSIDLEHDVVVVFTNQKMPATA